MTQPYCVFDGAKQIALGDLLSVALAVKKHIQRYPQSQPLIFDRYTGHVKDVQLEGDDRQIEAWLRANIPEGFATAAKSSAKSPAKTRGRPKLGVVSREITLLPRQWEWLADQPSGASATLRRLVDNASKDPQEQRRKAQAAASRLATALAGNMPGFEEAMRALYADDQKAFSQYINDWPKDVRENITFTAKMGSDPF